VDKGEDQGIGRSWFCSILVDGVIAKAEEGYRDILKSGVLNRN
jgi:hypothetical protein